MQLQPSDRDRASGIDRRGPFGERGPCDRQNVDGFQITPKGRNRVKTALGRAAAQTFGPLALRLRRHETQVVKYRSHLSACYCVHPRRPLVLGGILLLQMPRHCRSMKPESGSCQRVCTGVDTFCASIIWSRRPQPDSRRFRARRNRVNRDAFRRVINRPSILGNRR